MTISTKLSGHDADMSGGFTINSDTLDLAGKSVNELSSYDNNMYPSLFSFYLSLSHHCTSFLLDIDAGQIE